MRNQDNRQRETRKKRKHFQIKRNLIQDSAVKSRFHPVPDIGQLLISRFPGQLGSVIHQVKERTVIIELIDTAGSLVNRLLPGRIQLAKARHQLTCN